MRPIQAAVLLVMVAGVAPLSAQTTSTRGGFHAGAGVSVSTTSDTLVPQFLVPIDVMSHLRVEPELAYWRRENRRTSDSDVIIARSSSTAQTLSSTSVGAGLFLVQTREKLNLQYGARLGYVRIATDIVQTSVTPASTLTGTTSSTLPGFFVGPALGGEYFLSDRFSIGVELHLRYTSVEGPEQSTLTPLELGIIFAPPRATTSQSTIETRAAVIARVYVK